LLQPVFLHDHQAIKSRHYQAGNQVQ